MVDEADKFAELLQCNDDTKADAFYEVFQQLRRQALEIEGIDGWRKKHKSNFTAVGIRKALGQFKAYTSVGSCNVTLKSYYNIMTSSSDSI